MTTKRLIIKANKLPIKKFKIKNRFKIIVIHLAKDQIVQKKGNLMHFLRI
jgi:hypothetical protein